MQCGPKLSVIGVTDLERDLASALTCVAFGLVRGTRKSAQARPAVFFSGFE
jgi:hypothetical protein